VPEPNFALANVHGICREVAMARSFMAVAMPVWAKRVSHIGPPESPSAIMRRAQPERGENRGPGKDFLESLTSGPELENSLAILQKKRLG